MTRPVLLASFTGAALGLAGLRLAEMPPRWVAGALVVAWVTAGVLATQRVARATLAVFTFSLQLGLALYLTEPAASSVGFSWPNAVALPVASLTALAALATAAASRRGPWLWGGGVAVTTALLALTTAASILATPVRRISVAHLVLLAAYFVIFLAAANAVQEARDLRLVLGVLTGSLALQSLAYFAQGWTGATFTLSGDWVEPSEEGWARFGGTVGTRPAAFSSFLLPLLLLAVAGLLAARQGWSRLRLGLAASAGLAALILTYTRASWAGFALGFAYLLAAGARRRMWNRRNTAVVVAMLLVVSLALAPRILRRVTVDHAAAFEERWDLIRMALRVIEAHPLTGAGAGAYPYVFRNYLTPELADRWLFVVHNAYLLRAAETGLPGLAALLLFLAVIFRRASPERLPSRARLLGLGCRAGILAMAWEMLWDISLGPAAMGLMWFLAGITTAARKLEGTERC